MNNIVENKTIVFEVKGKIISKEVLNNKIMKDEYIVINLSKLKERLEELERVEAQQVGNLNEYIARGERKALENILSSNFTQLTPLLENAIDEGMLIQRTINDKVNIPATRIKHYINNLKLDI